MFTVCSMDELSQDVSKLYDCVKTGDVVLMEGDSPCALVMSLRGYDEETALLELREALQEARNRLALKGKYDEARGGKFPFVSQEDINAEIYAGKHSAALTATA